MYTTLKSNFCSLCLDSVFLTTFPSHSTSSASFFTTTALRNRRRINFFSSLSQVRSTVFSFLTTYTNLLLNNRAIFSFMFYRNLNSLSFLRCLKLGSSGPFPFLRRISSKLRNTGITRFRLTKIRARLSIKKKKNKKRTYFSSRIRSLFNLLSVSSIFVGRTFPFDLNVFPTSFSINTTNSLFFCKKLLRLFLYQLGFRLLASTNCLLNDRNISFKSLVCAFAFSSASFSTIANALSVRFVNSMVMSYVSIVQLSSSKFFSSYPLVSFFSMLRRSLSFGIYTASNSHFFTAVFFTNFVRFLSMNVLYGYSYMFSDIISHLRKTFNLYVNNASARNVFSAFSRGSKMIYGTTSGSFKLRKRIRYKKHAMFMVAAKFYRTLSYYYRSKLVRSVYLHFTGYRRSFMMILQFFRTVMRRNIKHHFKPLYTLFKFQPSSPTHIVGTTNSVRSSFFIRSLPMHLSDISFSSSTSTFGDMNKYLSKFTSFTQKRASTFFSTAVVPVLKKKGLFSNKLRSPILYSTMLRAYSTVSTSAPMYPGFFISRELTALVSSTDTLDIHAFTSYSSSVLIPARLSSWCYSTVYSSIIRTRRHYKMYKKLIMPLFSRTQTDSFRCVNCVSSSSVQFIRSLRSRFISFSLFSKNKGSFSNVVSTYFSLMSLSNRSYSTVAKGTQFSSGVRKGGKFSKKKKTFSKKRVKRTDAISFKSRVSKLVPSSYLSVFRTRMAIFLNTILSGSSVRYRPVIAHGGCYKRRRISDRRYWF